MAAKKRKPKKAAMKPDELQRLISEAGLNQTTAAAFLERDRRTIIRWLNGTIPITEPNALYIRAKFTRRK